MNKHIDNSERGPFVEDKSLLLGNLDYDLVTPEKAATENTTIGDDFSGKGIENQLKNAVILHARKHVAKAVSPCTLSKSLFATEHDTLID